MQAFIGQGATLIMHSDRHAYTVVAVSKTGKVIKATKDTATRIDTNGASEAQEYQYNTDSNADLETFRKRKNGHYYNTQGVRLSIGERYSYYDYSF